MREYIFRRVLLLIPVLLFVSMLTFTVFRIMPGDVLDVLYADSSLTPAQIAELRHQLGMDKSLPEQYIEWIGGIIRLDAGDSLWTRRPVFDEIKDRLPVTVELALLAFSLQLLIGIPLGVLSATHQDSPLDQVVRVFAILGLATPGFWLATLALVYLSSTFKWIPPLGGITPFFENPFLNLQQFFLPGIILGFSASAVTMRLTRNTLLEVIRQDYVRTAFAKGLETRRVWWVHAVRNAMIPVITAAGTHLGALMGGTVITENIFSLPGVGQLTLSAIQHKDIPQLEINVLFIAFIFVSLNMLVDLSYAWLDPRIRFK
jgi:peptide/nickel transport system permease protein